MRETEYAYGVSRVRVHELALLTHSDVEQMINADDYKSVLRLLDDKGWKASDFGEDIAGMLDNRQQEIQSFLIEAMPDFSVLNCLIVQNDFQNIKAAIKSMFSSVDAMNNLVSPNIIEKETVAEAINKKKFELLPVYAVDAAKDAYNAIVRNTGGQNADIILDRAGLETSYNISVETKNQLLIDIVTINCDTANIKTAYRCAKYSKDKSFIERALCRKGKLDVSVLAEKAAEGIENLMEYLSSGVYSDVAEALKDSTTAFEKCCDDMKTELVRSAKYKSFGLEPFAAYFIANEAEIKNMRIILNAKLGGLNVDVIKSRVRSLYV